MQIVSNIQKSSFKIHRLFYHCNLKEFKLNSSTEVHRVHVQLIHVYWLGTPLQVNNVILVSH